MSIVSAVTPSGTVAKAVIATLITIAVIKMVASSYPSIPLLPTIAAHV